MLSTAELPINIFFSLPEDSLDLVLAATYNHSTERFADKEDLYMQPETIGCDTWRRLRNTFDKVPAVVVPLVSYFFSNCLASDI